MEDSFPVQLFFEMVVICLVSMLLVAICVALTDGGLVVETP